MLRTIVALTLVGLILGNPPQSLRAQQAQMSSDTRSILAEIGTAQEAHRASLAGATTQEAINEEERAWTERTWRFSDRLMECARRAPGDRLTVDGLTWVLTGGDARANTSDEAFSLLQMHHLSDPRLAPLCLALSHRHTFASVSSFLRSAVDGSEDRQVRATATYVLACRSRQSGEDIQRYLSATAERRVQMGGDGTRPNLVSLSRAQSARLLSEANGLFRQLIDDYADVRIGLDRLGDVASAHLERYREIKLGQVAPDIRGTDIDGRPFCLSDYRGKVIVLDFWGNW
jgi:hypothetical protein